MVVINKKIPRNGLLKNHRPTGSRNLSRDFYTCESGTGQQVAQLHVSLMMTMMIKLTQDFRSV